jgi:c-di-AMP phosphodiesterase-like protein
MTLHVSHELAMEDNLFIRSHLMPDDDVVGISITTQTAAQKHGDNEDGQQRENKISFEKTSLQCPNSFKL